MATLTSTVFANNQPRNLVTGNITVSGTFNWGAATCSAGDVVFLAKVPHGAHPIELRIDHTGSSTVMTCDYGWATGGASGGGASYSALISGAVISTITRTNVKGRLADVSVSDNSPANYGILSAKVEACSGCTSAVINFTFTYSMDD